jgi:hypothetical protein
METRLSGFKFSGIRIFLVKVLECRAFVISPKIKTRRTFAAQSKASLRH